MALSLTPAPEDVAAQYWPVERFRPDKRARTVEVLLCGYRDKAASDAGEAPLAHTTMLVTEAQLGVPVMRVTLDDIYPALREARQLTSQGVDQATREADRFFATAGDA